MSAATLVPPMRRLRATNLLRIVALKYYLIHLRHQAELYRVLPPNNDI